MLEIDVVKKLIPIVSYCGLLALSLNALAAAKSPEIIELDHIVAVVNDNVITQTELNSRVKEVRKQLQANNTKLPPDPIFRKQILERMISDEIQLQLASSSGIRIDDEGLNRVIENIARQNNMDLDTFRNTLVNDGYDFAHFREEIRKEMILTQLRKRQVESKVFVSEAEVAGQLEKIDDRANADNEYHLGHILIPIPESAKPEEIEAAKQQADQVIAQLHFGADFSQTAISVSAGQNALQGGDLGWIKHGQLPTIFASIIPSMEIGAITPPIRSANGFHIVKLFEKRVRENKRVIQQTLARHILIKTSTILPSYEAREKLARLRERIVNGADFAELAKASSDDPGSAAEGGNLGWVSPGQMVPEFQDAMDKLQPGEISQPFESQYGWHIVQVLSRRQHDDTDSYLKNQARQSIYKRKVAEETEQWLRRIRDEAYVEYRLEE